MLSSNPRGAGRGVSAVQFFLARVSDVRVGGSGCEPPWPMMHAVLLTRNPKGTAGVLFLKSLSLLGKYQSLQPVSHSIKG